MFRLIKKDFFTLGMLLIIGSGGAIFWPGPFAWAQYAGGPSVLVEPSEIEEPAVFISPQEIKRLEEDVMIEKKDRQQQIDALLDEQEPSAQDLPLRGNDFEHSPEKVTLWQDQSKQPEADEALSEPAEAQKIEPVEIDGDIVEFFQDENKAVIEGNVVITKGDVYLLCDRVEYHQETSTAIAQGHVVLIIPDGEIRGDSLTFNFETMTGDFQKARIFSPPFYGAGQEIVKINEDLIEMRQGYMTTCDLDHPHFRLNAKKIDVYQSDKITARSLTPTIGRLPIMWFPQYTKVIQDRQPRYMITPGHNKEWGGFLLTRWRYFFHEHFRGNVKVDFREKKDVALGLDSFYQIPNYGQGLIDLYYVGDPDVSDDEWRKDRPGPAIDRQRFKAQWRHHWRIDDKTRALWQYYRISDRAFLKDYFKREHQHDPDPKTYFLLTRNFHRGILSFRTDKRVNRFTSSVERLPEVRYDFFNQKIGKTNFYLQNRTIYSNLSYPKASPSDVRPETHRIHSDYKLSYPMKLGFIEMTPYVGERITYYSQTKDPVEKSLTRTAFRTGADLRTRFFRTFDVQGSLFGLPVDRLRHIIAPGVSYLYMHRPSVPSKKIKQFDSIDSLDQEHKLVFSIDNRFQTKRDDRTVDLLFMGLSSDFYLKEDERAGSFKTVNSDVEFRPTDWLTFYSDTSYDAQDARLISANHEIQFRDPKRWSFNLSRRYRFDQDDQLTAEFQYKINPKWRVSVYERFYLNSGNLKEQQYTLTRDLHCWEMDITLNDRHKEGTTIWVVFRMKAFPEMALDFIRASFNRRDVGAQ